MQPRDRGGKAQAETGTRQRAALFEPHKALDRAPTFFQGDTGAAIGHRQFDVFAVACRMNADFRHAAGVVL